ncbi:hypothetical protein FBY31_0566 [Arthrobacter sp. SLBN-100]|uniref:hypothetical protein n=1 Tax=Arthrobacter sp. SLBN-100 TaxID=2768450 RepID=UPI00114F86AA|nr:hypothetical protein [Arthrobacter sp. SLBN-100]TQJ66551.1 hypothetical protein FBY31_0566 [Arthrobacter sp. SLBN-100]
MVWGGTLLLAAIGAAITAWLQPRITDAIETVIESGDPISVVTSLKPSDGDVSLPASRSLSSADLERMNALEPAAQIAWLEENSGVPVGAREFTVTMKGNRSHLVRVTDIRPVSECEDPSRGTLVRTGWGRGAVPPSTILYLFVDDPAKPVELYTPGAAQTEPFFPGRTITLSSPEEEEYVVLNLIPSRTKLCKVHVEMTVMDGEKEIKQRITDQDIVLAPFEEAIDPSRESAYEAVYLGGSICKKVVPAPEDYEQDIKSACGPGNYRG